MIGQQTRCHVRRPTERARSCMAPLPMPAYVRRTMYDVCAFLCLASRARDTKTTNIRVLCIRTTYGVVGSASTPRAMTGRQIEKRTPCPTRANNGQMLRPRVPVTVTGLLAAALHRTACVAYANVAPFAAFLTAVRLLRTFPGKEGSHPYGAGPARKALRACGDKWEGAKEACLATKTLPQTVGRCFAALLAGAKQ